MYVRLTLQLLGSLVNNNDSVLVFNYDQKSNENPYQKNVFMLLAYFYVRKQTKNITPCSNDL